MKKSEFLAEELREMLECQIALSLAPVAAAIDCECGAVLEFEKMASCCCPSCGADMTKPRKNKIKMPEWIK